jgi:hypothetical protein
MTNVFPCSPAPLRDVLYELSLAKEVPDAELIDDFVRRFPDYASAITDFAIELAVDALNRNESVTPSPAGVVSPAVSRAMSTFQNALYANKQLSENAKSQETSAVSVASENLFSKLDRASFRKLAQDLNVNTVFVCKLRDRQIELSTIPTRFLELVASKLKCAKEVVAAHFAGEMGGHASLQFYKSDLNPNVAMKQSFEEAVRQSGLTQEQQAILLQD